MIGRKYHFSCNYVFSYWSNMLPARHRFHNFNMLVIYFNHIFCHDYCIVWGFDRVTCIYNLVVFTQSQYERFSLRGILCSCGNYRNAVHSRRIEHRRGAFCKDCFCCYPSKGIISAYCFNFQVERRRIVYCQYIFV